jgi:hypothetical protein
MIKQQVKPLKFVHLTCHPFSFNPNFLQIAVVNHFTRKEKIPHYLINGTIFEEKKSY